MKWGQWRSAIIEKHPLSYLVVPVRLGTLTWEHLKYGQ